jgi:hypothetical protein
MLRHRAGQVCPDLAMRPLSTRPRVPSQCGKIYIGVQRLGKTDKRPFCRCRGMGQWDYWRELLQLFQFSDRPIDAGSWVFPWLSHTITGSASGQRGRAARRDRPRPATRGGARQRSGAQFGALAHP